MRALLVDGLLFDFPAQWQAMKYDDWQFYNELFKGQLSGIKAVDCLALSNHGELFLIEVKDYCHQNTRVPLDLPQAVVSKVLGTLAALLPASLHAKDPAERKLAQAILQCRAIKVVLHIELPEAQPHPKKKNLLVSKEQMANLKDKLRQHLRAIDVNPKVVSIAAPRNTAWHVTRFVGNLA
jgi:hypothetical protein